MTRRLARLSLAGEHVRIRLHAAEDGEPAFALLDGQQEILRWLVWDGPGSPAELSEYYAQGCFESENGSDFRLAIEERASGSLAGSINVRFAGHPGQGDVGYWLGLAFHGRGLGGEALALATHLAFQHLEAQSLYAWVFVGNLASRRILERTGYTLARTVAGRVQKHGRRVDEWHFVLLESDWRRTRALLRPREEDVRWEQEPAREKDLDSPARPRGSG